MTGRIPLHVLTGFLGSGKTTLLNRVLSQPAWADSAVLINEIGAVAIDHELVDRIDSGEHVDIVVLKGGCTCCALRGDMVAALRELYQRRADGAIPAFARVVLETTGLADPAPVLYTLVADPALRHKFERGVVVTTFDAIHGLEQLSRHPESCRQLALADRIVVTKTDLDQAAERTLLRDGIGRINPVADIVDAQHATTPEALLRESSALSVSDDGRAYDPHKHGAHSNLAYESDKRFFVGLNAEQDVAVELSAKKLCDPRSEGEQTLNQTSKQASMRKPLSLASEHSPNVASISVTLDEPVNWSRFSIWLTLLLHAHGSKILRFKALLDVAGWPAPVALDAIHHMIHTPRHLDRWSGGRRASRLVFIAQDLRLERIAPSLRAFLAGDVKTAAVRAQ